MQRILALDLGQHKSAARLHVTDGRPDFSTTVASTPQALHDLGAAADPDLVIIEASFMAYWVHDLFAAVGKRVIVTANNGPAWRWKNTRSKSDRSDAAKLIKMHLTGQLEPVHVPAHGVRQWRGLIQQRHAFVGDRTRLRNRITGQLRLRGLSLAAAKDAWTKTWREQVEQLARPLGECPQTEVWRGRLHQDLAMLAQAEDLIRQTERALAGLAEQHPAVDFLRREPGVGPRLAETLAAVIDDPLRFRSGKEVGCYVGLTPRHWQSGDTARQGHISKQGSRLLRTLLVEVSWLGLRHNGWMREVYERVKRGVPGRAKIAIVAVARRLLIRLWARWRDWVRAGQPAPAA
jgi:transposase